MSERDEPVRPTANPAGFFEMTPARRTLLGAAGTAAVIFLGYVSDAFQTRKEIQDKFNGPVAQTGPPLPQPVRVAADPAAVFREVGDSLAIAERHAATVNRVTAANRSRTVLATAKKTAGEVGRLVSLAETRLRTLEGRPLLPEQAAERDRLLRRAAEVRRTLKMVIQHPTPGEASGP